MTKFRAVKMLVLVAGLLVVGVSSASAAACSTFVGSAVSTLTTCDINLTYSGQSFTVTFSNFSDGGASNMVLNAVDSSNLTGQAGLQFVGSPAGTPIGTFTGFSYTASITSACNSGFTCYIIGQYQQAAFGALGNPSGSVTYTTDTCNVPPVLTPSASTYGPSLCGSYIPAGSNDVVTASYVPGTNTLNNLETDVYVGSVTNAPEPTTFVLMGAGLGLIGMLRRKTARR